MSGALDVNILLYASDEASDFHAPAAKFMEECASRRELICIGWATIVSYLRIATHHAIFARPLSHAEAMSNIEALAGLPHVRVLAEEEGFWDVYSRIVEEVPTRGNLVPAAHLAALLRQHGVSTIYTRDRDFLKFDFLRVIDPLVESR